MMHVVGASEEARTELAQLRARVTTMNLEAAESNDRITSLTDELHDARHQLTLITEQLESSRTAGLNARVSDYS